MIVADVMTRNPLYVHPDMSVPDARALIRNRITSYNVCYTKLLRDYKLETEEKADKKAKKPAAEKAAPSEAEAKKPAAKKPAAKKATASAAKPAAEGEAKKPAAKKPAAKKAAAPKAKPAAEAATEE